jgi:type IX secretion system PorP/SprF family membrane protein
MAGVVTALTGQQIGYNSHMPEAQSFWNPAATAVGSEMETTVFARRQWLGFAGAPLTGFASFAYPVIDYNMSVGAMLYTDQLGPVSKTGLRVNYSYKLQEVLADYDQLAIGLSASASQYAFSTNDLIVNQQTDRLLQEGAMNTIYPTVSAGFMYTRNGRRDEDRKLWVSFSMQQIVSGNVEILGTSAERQQQYFFGIGTRRYGYDSYLEPYFTVNLTRPELVDMLIGVRYEMLEKFWAGVGYSTVNDLAVQGGWIIPDIGGRYTALRIGALANIATSGAAGDFGPGIELLISYTYDLD